MKKSIITVILAAVALLCGCNEDSYKAEVNELRLVRLSPESGYAGDIVTILGRNFSTYFGENKVMFGDAQAKVIEISKDELQVIVPENATGVANVSVTTPSDSAEGLVFEYMQKPEFLYKVITFAGNGTAVNHDDIETNAGIPWPEGMSWGPDGLIYINQRNTGELARVRKLNPKSGLVTTFASTEPFNYPWGGGFASDGNYYVASKSTNKIAKITPDGIVSEFKSGTTLNNPMYVAFDSKDNMWIASRNDGAVYKSKDGVLLETYKGTGYYPSCVAVDSKDRAVFASNKLYQIYMIEDGEMKAIAGSGTKGTKDNFEASLESGDPMKVNLVGINAIFAAKDGSLYITDLSFTVLKLTPDSNGSYANGKITLVAGIPFKNAIKNGKSDVATFKYPSGIIVSDDCREIYVSESTSHCIRKMTLL